MKASHTFSTVSGKNYPYLFEANILPHIERTKFDNVSLMLYCVSIVGAGKERIRTVDVCPENLAPEPQGNVEVWWTLMQGICTLFVASKTLRSNRVRLHFMNNANLLNSLHAGVKEASGQSAGRILRYVIILQLTVRETN